MTGLSYQPVKNAVVGVQLAVIEIQNSINAQIVVIKIAQQTQTIEIGTGIVS